MMRALIIVDIQNDFVAGGTLEVPNGEQIIPLVNELAEVFDLVVATQDWHPQTHKSFASNHADGKPFEKIILGGLEQVLWPDHCVQGTPGAEFHAELRMDHVEAIFRKGMDPEIDSYSGFYDNGHKKSTGLAGYLKERKVEVVYVCGVAADYCVFYTAQDALKEGFQTIVIEDATRAIDRADFEKAKSAIQKNGGDVLDSSFIMQNSKSR
jgi:nicotinamidase/pyrazinamidase